VSIRPDENAPAISLDAFVNDRRGLRRAGQRLVAKTPLEATSCSFRSKELSRTSWATLPMRQERIPDALTEEYRRRYSPIFDLGIFTFPSSSVH
jgi:hypothetical protein